LSFSGQNKFSGSDKKSSGGYLKILKIVTTALAVFLALSLTLFLALSLS
jgi:hypothetical protein